MASKKELADQAIALGAELSVEVTTDGLNHEGLTALVADLERQKLGKASDLGEGDAGEALLEQAGVTPVGTEPVFNAVKPVDGAQDDSLGGLPRPDAPPPQRYNHVVAEGKSVTTRRGSLGAFQSIKASDLGEGDAGKALLEQLVESGHVSKAPAPTAPAA